MDKTNLLRIINNLNEVTVNGKKNCLIIADAITTLETIVNDPSLKTEEEQDE